METEHLREFAVLANACSFTLAARELNMTQSTLSKHIAALERDLGAELFDRTGKGVALTEAGKALYDQAVTVCRLVASARRAVRAAAHDAPSAAVGAPLTPASFARPARGDVRLRQRAPRLAARFGLGREETTALVLFLEEHPISEIASDLGMSRDEAATVLASAYRKLGARGKAEARSVAYSDAE